MDAIGRLTAIEDIKALMARRVRSIDEKDWAGFADCYAPDAASYSHGGPGAPAVIGNTAIANRVSNSLLGITTVHQVHAPEITIESDVAASAIWPLNDLLSWERDGRRHWLRGYGHYRQIYSKASGRWLISEHRLTRLLMERGSEETGIDYGPVGPPKEESPRL